MNGLSLKELVKNDEKLDSKLKTDLQQITMIMEEQKSQNYSNEKMDEEVYCVYLKTKLNKKKMKKLFEVLLLKKLYSEEKSMNQLCELLRKHRPDLMRPRILNLILGIINVTLSKTAITIAFLMTGILSLYFFRKYVSQGAIPYLEKLYYDNMIKNTEVITTGIIESHKIAAKSLALSNVLLGSAKTGAITALYGTTMYNILRQASYFMPKGFRLGNRIRARHSARKLIGDTRKNKIS